MSTSYPTTHQYEPLRAPSGWGDEEKRLIVQLTDLFDDVYRRFGRLRFEDLGKRMQSRIEDGEGNIAEMHLTTDGLAAAVNNNRLSFSATGLTIKNAAGATVFSQDNDSGNLTVSGRVSATGGTLGGFTIDRDALHNGTSIVLSSDGYVRLGDLSITDDASFGPSVEAAGGLKLRVGGADYLTAGEGSVEAGFALKARYGLYVNPGDVTANAPNAYIDPATGKLYRSTSGGGGTGAVTAGISLARNAMTTGETIVIYGSHSGGVAPYTYVFGVSANGGAYQTVAGGGSTRNHTIYAAGTYRFRLTVTDSGGNTDTAYSEMLTVSQPQSTILVEVYANKSTVTGSGSVTWTMVVSGGSGSHGYSMTIYKDGGYFDNTSSYTITRTLTQPGTYYASVLVTDLVTLETKAASGGYVTVTSSAQYAMTTGTNVIIRSGPGTSYSEVARVTASGTYVEITGSLQSGFYPVYWNGYTGYMSASYLQLV